MKWETSMSDEDLLLSVSFFLHFFGCLIISKRITSLMCKGTFRELERGVCDARLN